MKFRVVHKLLSYLLAAAALGTLASSGAVAAAAFWLMAVAAVASWYADPGTRAGRWVERLDIPLKVLATLVLGRTVFRIVQSFPEPDLAPILDLVLFLLAYMLFHRRTSRDYLQLYILTFLSLLAGAWLAQSILFVVGFGAYVIIGTWTLILFHLRHEIEDNYLVRHLPEAASEKVTADRVLNSQRVVGRSFFLATGLVALGVLAGAALVFVFVPRIGVGFLGGAVRRKVQVVGFSDQVKLGQHGVISQDNRTVILRARVERIAAMTDEGKRNEAMGDLYWRGTVYDRYDSGQWERSRREETRTEIHHTPWPDGGELLLLEDGLVQRTPQDRRRLMREADMQTVEAAALSFPVGFALDVPVAYRWVPPRPGAFVTTAIEPRWSGEVGLRTARMLGDGTLRPLQDWSGGHYIAYSRPPQPRVGAGPPLAEVADTLAPYLVWPTPLSKRVLDLARTLARDQPTAAGKVQAVSAWLRKTHTYTTNLKRNTDIADPLEDFLFHQTDGHCEYFASAGAVLLRLMGVPTRYVNGFLGGEWNAMGGHITVRDNRAHSWVEAYVGTFGWMRVDPTPPMSRPSNMSRLRQFADSIELFWSRWVIDYNASLQVDLAKRLGRQFGFERRRPTTIGTLPRPSRKTAIIVALAATALVLLIAIGRRTKFGDLLERTRRASEGPPIFRVYRAALGRLAARGWERLATETPHEFVARLRESSAPDVEVMERLTSTYAAARYGGRDVPPEVVRGLGEAVAAIGRAQAQSARSAA